jgi:hypothetical protein
VVGGFRVWKRLEQIDQILIDVDIIGLAGLDQRIQIGTGVRAGNRVTE